MRGGTVGKGRVKEKAALEARAKEKVEEGGEKTTEERRAQVWSDEVEIDADEEAEGIQEQVQEEDNESTGNCEPRSADEAVEEGEGGTAGGKSAELARGRRGTGIATDEREGRE